MRINYRLPYLRLRHCSFLVVLLFFGCSNDEKHLQETARLNNFLTTVGQPVIGDERQVYILSLVENGCHSCIEDVLNYAKKLSTNQSLYFIFSGQSLKNINIALQAKEVIGRNIIKDKRYLTKSTNLIPNTAIAYFIYEGKVVAVTDINSANVEDVFDEIMEYVGN